MSKTSFVTGAAGFIGSHLIDQLLARGHRVIGVDNLTLGRRSNLAQALPNPQFTFKELDANDPAACEEFIRKTTPAGVDTVWHMAANSDIQAGGKDPDLDFRLTFLTTFNVLKLMQNCAIPQLVFASSSAIYGAHDGELSEDTGPLFPVSNYGAMKLASEGAITAALEKYLKRVWIYRFPNVVGGRATHGVIFDLLNKLKSNSKELEVLGDGLQEKPYLHVKDLVDAMLFLFERGNDKLNYFNIAPETGASTVRFIADSVVAAAAPQAKINYTGGSKGWVGDVPKFRYSTQKLKGLGWSPKLTSNQAVELAIRENM